MRAAKPIIWTLAVLLLLGGAAGAIFMHGTKQAKQAEEQHTARYNEYQNALRALDDSSLTVTEQGSRVGVYSLADLGLYDSLHNAVENAYTMLDRMAPADFAELSVQEKKTWAGDTHAAPMSYSFSDETLSVAPVLEDLRSVTRTAPEDARIAVIEGVYSVVPERYGNQLRENVVSTGLRAYLTRQNYIPGRPLDLAYEITELDCYERPAVLSEQVQSQLEQAARTAWEQTDITVHFDRMTLSGATETITREMLRSIFSIDEQGEIHMDKSAVDEIVAGWAKKYNVENTPLIFDSYVKGYTPIDFITVSYVLDERALSEQLQQNLILHESADLQAPVFCYDQNGDQFLRNGTWIEVDIDNQQLTYFRDGEMLLNTDVVTGALFNGHMTPTGLYFTHHKQTNIWLTGEDYTVFVNYWIGVIDEMVGLHDATWREHFGGENYAHNGSHGCINMPFDAIASIFDLVDDDTPVIIHGRNRYFQPGTGNSDATPNPLRGTTAVKPEE